MKTKPLSSWHLHRSETWRP